METLSRGGWREGGRCQVMVQGDGAQAGDRLNLAMK